MLAGNQFVTTILQITRNLLAIALVHLASIGLDEDAGHSWKRKEVEGEEVNRLTG